MNVPTIMGILNVTPDSFSDGGRFEQIERALDQAHFMVQSGAGIIDVGGESTRPNAQPVPLEVELERVIPVVYALRAELDVLISIDTMKPQVMEMACEAGVNIINDVNALQAEGALAVAAHMGSKVCLMHKQGDPKTMQTAPDYDNVTDEVIAFLERRIEACLSTGISQEKIILDPGFGFGKTLEHNLQLMRDIPKIKALGFPVLVGVSRKSMIGALTNQDEPAKRVAGSVAAALYAATQGADILRAHDVRETSDALKVQRALS